ncbi:MAG: GNAT family N-acetyltransferase [Caulobacteraceae bacterium]
MGGEVRIAPFETLTPAQREQASDVMWRGFAHQPAAWPTIAEARAEVATFYEDEERFALALLEGENLRGWIGAIESYSHAWELHPIVVDPDCQKRGFGRLLIEALEAEARADGILTIHLGSDDDYGGTSLYGADLTTGALEKLAAIEPRGGGHPVFFYLKLGYQLTGVLPDANGPGKPDIYLAKTL